MSYSILSRFLCCRERFRLLAVNGLQVRPEFNHRLEYGNLWHVCEEAGENWRTELDSYCRLLGRQYPESGEQIVHWGNVCRVQFPIYVEWKQGRVNGEVLLRERVFRVPYTLPSGRTVFLRGKFDAVVRGPDAIYLREIKTKGDIHPQQLARQLTFDLQTMLYLTALADLMRPVGGVLYVVVRRPLSGGRHSIVQRKGRGESRKGAETSQEFYQRLAGEIRGAVEPDGEHYFFRCWKVDVTAADLERFGAQCLRPLLEQMCDWWRWITADLDNPWKRMRNSLHYRFPYGVFNPALEGSIGDLDEYLDCGSSMELHRASSLFPELKAKEKPCQK